MMDRLQEQKNKSKELRELINHNSLHEAILLFKNLHPGDQVEVFDFLNDNQKEVLLEKMDTRSIAQLFSHQGDEDTLEAAEHFSIKRLADVLEEMEPDEAADLLGDLPPQQAAEVLEQMEEADDVLSLLNYPDETAGGRMTTDFISLFDYQTTDEAIELLRARTPDQEVSYYLLIINQQEELVGITGLRDLVVAQPSTKMSALMDSDVFHIDAWEDQEEVSRMMIQYDLSSLPVVDENKKLVGVITHDDILDVIQEEATEDILLLANVTNRELEPDSPIGEQLRGRLPWLLLNTLTALFASWIISNFEGLIGQVAVLAIFQSVVAGQGGNAASQAVAMFVRALALENIPLNQTIPLLGKQVLVGLLQGLMIGAVVGTGVALWRGNLMLGIVLGTALVGNLILAGIVGTLIPMGLKSIGQDPALASSVLVTAVTDSLGFLIFLSLANLFIDFLI